LDDDFFIREEITLTFKVFCAFFVVGAVIAVFGVFIGWDLCVFIIVELSVICTFIICFISTFWVLRKTRLSQLDSSANANEPVTFELPAGTIPMESALRDRKVTTEFIKHLVNELNVENIFFLSDVIAFKKTFVRRQVLESLQGFDCKVTSQLARLQFIRGFTRYAWAISKTYVDNTSSLYVTAISGVTRDAAIDELEAMNPDIEEQVADAKDVEDQNTNVDSDAKLKYLSRLHLIFDQCAVEVYQELQNSYARFAATKRYKQIIETLQSRQQQQP
jgi:hypothetical protein